MSERFVDTIRMRTKHAHTRNMTDEWFNILSLIDKAARSGDVSTSLPNIYGDNANHVIMGLRMEGFRVNFDNEGQRNIDINWDYPRR